MLTFFNLENIGVWGRYRIPEFTIPQLDGLLSLDYSLNNNVRQVLQRLYGLFAIDLLLFMHEIFTLCTA